MNTDVARSAVNQPIRVGMLCGSSGKVKSTRLICIFSRPKFKSGPTGKPLAFKSSVKYSFER
jgi:hypothetical protein